MIFPKSFSRFLARAAAIWCGLALVHVAQADLVWTPDGGWRIEGGVLEGLAEPGEAQNAVTMMNRARIEQEVGNPGNALRIYRRIIRRYGTSVLAPEARFQSARIHIDRRQWSRAFDQLQAIVSGHPDYPRFNEVVAMQYQIADALRQGERLRLFWVVPGFRSRERAVEYFEQVVDNAPFSEWAPDSLLHAARLQVRRRQLDEAIDLFDRMISDYPNHPRVPEAFFGLADAFSSRVQGPAYDQGATREAMSYFEDFAILHPQHPRAAEAEEGVAAMRDMLAQSRVVIGDFYLFRRANFHAARVFYNEAITLSPESPSAQEARERLGVVERREAARRRD